MTAACYLRRLAAVVVPILASGCGLSTPELQPPFQTYQDEQITINHIVNRVKCELIQGIVETLNDDFQQARDNASLGGSRKLEWLKDWSAKVTLMLTAVESSALAPGLSYNEPLASAVRKFSNGTSVTTTRAFTVGFGGSMSSQATRTDKIDFFFAFKDFLPPEDPEKGMPASSVPCATLGNFLASDLKLGEWLKEAIIGVYTDSITTAKGYTLPIDVLSHEVNFLVMQNANLNPGFKLTEFALGQSGSPLFQAARNRTDDVLVTLGPIAQGTTFGPQMPVAGQAPQSATGAVPSSTPAQPSQAVVDSHLASEIGAAVAAAIRSAQ